MKLIIPFLCLLLLLFSCNSTTPNNSNKNSNLQTQVDLDDLEDLKEEVLSPVNQALIDSQFVEGEEVLIADLVDGNTSFAFDLYQKIYKENENLIFSPYSLSVAFGMCYAGAVGETESNMRQVLHFPENNTESLHRAISDLDSKIRLNAEGSITLETANKIWKKDNFPIIPAYQELTKAYYKSPVGNFQNSAEAAKKINAWASKKTKGKIDKVVNEKSMMQARMALVNAIYFYGGWKEEFDPTRTAEDDFKGIEGTTKTDFMANKVKGNYAQFENHSVVELYYKDFKASMLLILPKEGYSLDEIRESFDLNQYKLWLDTLDKVQFNILLPKFKLEPPTIPLKEIFVDELDMKLPFRETEDKAYPDFSSMTSLPDIYIQEVFHKAFIEVNEKGTEAAAVTVTTMGGRGIKKSLSIKFDRPFFYIIKDNSTNSILFMGQVVKF